MKIEIDDTITGEEERYYLLVLLTNDEVLKQVIPVLDPTLFTTSYGRRLCRWIVDAYESMKCAIKDDLLRIFLERQKEIQDVEETTQLRKILALVSTDKDKLSIVDVEGTTEHVLKFLRGQKIIQTGEQILLATKNNKIEYAEQLIGAYRPLAINEGNGFNLATDTDKIIQALQPDTSRLFKIDGVLGQALGWFNKGEVSACMGPTKSGKSFLMLHIAMQALAQGLKVLFINGELSETMMIGRIWQYAVGQPIRLEEGQEKYRYSALFPTACDTVFTLVHNYIKPPMQLADVLPKAKPETEEYDEYLKNMTRPQVISMQTEMLTNTHNFRMHTTARNNMKLTDIEICIDNLQNFEDFTPDLVVVDYADLLQVNGRMEALEREDYIWRALGGIAQERDIALLTATQGNRQAADGKKYSASAGVGGAYKKLSHIGKFFCIAYEEEEAQDNLRRVFHSLERDGACSGEEVVCTNCFEVSKFATTSQWKKYVNHKAYTK